MEAGTLTKVLHDFFTTIDGELSLSKGEHFLIHKVLDKHWCYGQSQDKIGKFPLSHLHKVEIPQICDTECLFVAIAPFPGEQDGDLSFKQGEIIVGTREIGAGWYFGYIDVKKGIFPINYTWQIDTSLIKKTNNNKSVRKKARVKTTLKAQLDDELNLTEGQIVTVINILDDGWCYGETEDGKTGTFPEGFISYIEDNTDQTDRSLTTVHSSVSPSSCDPTTSLSSQDQMYKNFEENASASYVDEPAPNYFDLFPEASTSASSVTYENKNPTENVSVYENTATYEHNMNSLDIKPYAITLYPFNAQFPNELSFGAGEVVHLIKHVDSEWIEGTIDSSKGIFPMSYVNIIVDCPETTDTQRTSDQQTSNVTHNINPGALVKVEHTFQAQMLGDLSVTAGDNVTVVEIANSDWVNVKNKDGQIGLCPMGYLSPISECAEPNEDLLEDFVVIRNKPKDTVPQEEQQSKRLSVPHRPAPPVPGPGRTPLQKENTTAQNATSETTNQSNEGASNMTEDIKQKRADQRQNVISELVLTEKEYVRDLKLTYETFNLYDPNFLESKGIDVTTLFGNLLEVIQFAEELLDTILKAMKGCDENLQKIGPCFLNVTDKMQIVYGKYCGNHEAALVLLKKYENNEEIMAVFNKGIETLRYQIACFDMSSILIKPVQRILKYPLILYELIKCTEDDHPDKQATEEAWKAMTAVASYINEYKRRKDLVSKYLESNDTFITKMSKLSMHSVAKMSTRLSTKLSASLGLTNVTPDPVFDDLEQQFQSVEKCTLNLTKDVEQCMYYLKEEALLGERMSDFLVQYYQGTANEEIRKLRDIRMLIWTHFLQDLKTCIEKRVSSPLDFLTTLLRGPATLITKRHHKLLDYDAAISKSEKYKESRIAQEELSVAKSNYEALNQQLVEELPVLIDAATKLLVNCITAFANTRKLLSGRVTKQYLMLCESATQLSPHDILESFLVNHSLLWNQISRFTFGGTNPRTEEEQPKWCPQNEKQKTQLKNKYAKDKLYIVSQNIVSTSSLDLGAAVGTLVAVIKKQDPMGDSTRWYVDNGVAQGFLPAQKLRPFTNLEETTRSSSQETTSSSSMPDLISLESPKKEVKTTSESNLQSLLYLNVDEEIKRSNYANIEQPSSSGQHYQNLNDFYHALYEFAGNMPGTLSVSKGQTVRLVRPHDEKGNKEWWLVEDYHRRSGYVPHNYLTPVTTTKPQNN